MSYEALAHRVLNMGRPAHVHIPDGARVRHYGTKQWGTVLHSVPQGDGTVEYEVQRDEPLFSGGENTPTWWASYHIDVHEIAS